MMHFGRLMRVAVVLLVVAVYFVVVWLGLTEEGRRSLILAKSSATTGDYVIVNVKVTAIDVAQGLLHERIRVIPMGRFAVDRATPAVDLTLLINSVSGKQTVVYPKGQRISPIDFASVLSGNPNRYPFDRYTSDLDLLVTAAALPEPAAPAPRRAPPASAPLLPTPPAAAAPSTLAASEPPASQKNSTLDRIPEDGDVDPTATSLVVGPSDLTKSETVSINENFVASITGVKFEGQISQGDVPKLMRTAVVMRRANNVISVSVMVMAVMFTLAVSVMVMALRVAASPDAINLLPLSLCVSLIFGLPALRNTQPGVPGVGALGDYLSFIWAEFIVATAAIGLAWTWIVRTIRDQRDRESRGGG